MKFSKSLFMTAAIILCLLAISNAPAQCTRCGGVGISPLQLTFSSQQVGTTSLPQPVRIFSQTTAVTHISITEPFSQTNNCPSELRPGERCVIQVWFRPVAAGKVTGELTIDTPGLHQVALLGSGTPRSASLHALNEAATKQHTHYRLIDFGTFGGPESYLFIPNNYATILNNSGTVAGSADTDAQDPFFPGICFNFDCYVSHSFLSRNGTLTDLGALPGGGSSAASWISSNGLVTGGSENGTTDPSLPGFPVTHGVLWKDGRMTDLKTLPYGFESVGLAVNSRGQVAGAADNDISDPTAMFSDAYGWATQTRAFLWQDGVMKDLGTLGGTNAAAFLINDRGQIVGASYTSSAPSAYCAANFGAAFATGAFLYENGEMKNLRGFGGTCTFPTDLNNRGEVTGISTLSGDQYQHAFLWKNGSMHDLRNTIGGNNASAIAINDGGDTVGFASLSGDQFVHAALWRNGIMNDLGILNGDRCSAGYSINARGQVVGTSWFEQSACNSPNIFHAFLWEDGSMVDLNTLIPKGSPLYLTTPDIINDRGEIAGVGLDANLNEHAFLLIPCDPDDATCQAADGETSSVDISAVPTQKPSIANPSRLGRKALGRHIALPQH